MRPRSVKREIASGLLVFALVLSGCRGKAAPAAGLAAPEGAHITGLVAADARGNLLGAVFGDVDETVASALLVEALGNGQDDG